MKLKYNENKTLFDMSETAQTFHAELNMDWIHPWIGLDWLDGIKLL